ncbi:hypothetical protein C8A03DRAFT_35712 [Achaetomium macrosporum]|uniref:25S rRNA (uridine-N(3))-methyltransferase BMT5-like domain-containing protein n=1 Tax=Achaetomium macrosporum TaxID=79813 RepID=A0AAN7HCN1_9PEZI|nr:hypothetical protein C8A03DRAFT_35712 [Achaetomium macrosporum]
MAKRRGLLQHAAKAVKQQQQKKAAPGSKLAPGSKPGTKPGAGPPAAKKQKTGNSDKKKNNNVQQNRKPTIPFSPTDSILLVGEGDLSFAASLITHHKCTNVTATVLERDYAELSAKYPHVSSNISVIESPSNPHCRLLYGIDARKLHPPFTTATATKENKHQKEGAMKRIIFNFPHTGGKSTDVNRQVRHNQELLVAFFRRAQHSLAPGGTIVVTLFEGEPYTLWNIRDLARHAGLQVQRSFRFVAGAYPGYGHARTLGVVKNKRGEIARHAWKGEERAARSYVFVRKGEEAEEEGKKGRKRKRGGGDGSESSSDEDEDDDEDGEGAAGVVESEEGEEWGSDGDENEPEGEDEDEDGAPDEPGDGDGD